MLFDSFVRSCGMLSSVGRVLAGSYRSAIPWYRGFHCGNTLSMLPSKGIDFTRSIILKVYGQANDVSLIPSLYQQQTRTGLRVNYRPNAAKRLKKHGIQTRLSRRRSIIMLWKKVLKGRHTLST